MRRSHPRQPARCCSIEMNQFLAEVRTSDRVHAGDPPSDVPTTLENTRGTGDVYSWGFLGSDLLGRWRGSFGS